MITFPEYFYADGLAYKTRDVKPAYCSLHGDFVCFEVHGNKIKTSGRLSNVTCVFRIESLDRPSDEMMQRHIEQRTDYKELTSSIA